MRFWLGGPRVLGLRTGVSFGPEDFGSRRSRGQVPPTGDFVYVVRGGHGLVKVGISTNPAARLAQLRTSSPFPLDFVAVSAAGGQASAIESEAHRVLAPHRLEGEWFDCTPDVALAAVSASAQKFGIELAPHSSGQPSGFGGLTWTPKPPRRMSWAVGAMSTAAFLGAVWYEIETIALPEAITAIVVTFVIWCFVNAALAYSRASIT